MALYQKISGSSNINLYGGAFWNFRSGPTQAICSGDCQTNAVLYENNTQMYSYGISTINDKNLVMESGVRGNSHAVTVTHAANNGDPLAGFPQDKPAICAGYFRQS
jgi:glucan 1,3-beta-glucosidase